MLLQCQQLLGINVVHTAGIFAFLTKKKALLDVCLNEYETVNCQPNLIPLFPTGVLGGAILLLPTSPTGGQSDRIHFSPLLLLQKRTAIVCFHTYCNRQKASAIITLFTGGSVGCSLSSAPLSYCCYACQAFCSPAAHMQFIMITVAD